MLAKKTFEGKLSDLLTARVCLFRYLCLPDIKLRSIFGTISDILSLSFICYFVVLVQSRWGEGREEGGFEYVQS